MGLTEALVTGETGYDFGQRRSYTADVIMRIPCAPLFRV